LSHFLQTVPKKAQQAAELVEALVAVSGRHIRLWAWARSRMAAQGL
jgi:hypothetical protein